jgi:hypothetical protein
VYNGNLSACTQQRPKIKHEARERAWLGHPSQPQDLVSNISLGHLSAPESSSSYREYTKKDDEQLDIIIKGIQGDSKWMRLLQILDR